MVSIFHTLYGISAVFPALSLIVSGPCSFAETTFVNVFSSAPFVHPAGVSIGSLVVSVNITVPFVGSVLSAVICPSGFLVSIFVTLYGISFVFPALSVIVSGPCSFTETTFVNVFSSAPFVHPAGVSIGSLVVSVNITVPFVGSVLSAVICPSGFLVSIFVTTGDVQVVVCPALSSIVILQVSPLFSTVQVLFVSGLRPEVASEDPFRVRITFWLVRVSVLFVQVQQTGGTVSTVTVWSLGLDSFPALSIAIMLSVFFPCWRFVKV